MLYQYDRPYQCRQLPDLGLIEQAAKQLHGHLAGAPLVEHVVGNERQALVGAGQSGARALDSIITAPAKLPSRWR